MMTERKEEDAMRQQERKEEKLSHDNGVILDALDAAASHGCLDVVEELVAVLAHFQGCLCRFPNTMVKMRSVAEINAWLVPLLSGSSAFGSRNRYCKPTITEFKLRTGFQSSRRMFKQTLPSKSTFGW